MHKPACETPQAMGARHLRESGYAHGGAVHPDATEDEALVRRMVKPAALKRARGGEIEGDRPKSRPDRRGRGPKTINIIIGRGDGGDAMKEQMAAQQGMQRGMAMAAHAMPPHPPMAPPMAPHPPMGAMPGMPPGAAPPGVMPPRPGMPPQMAARGGTIKVRAHERRRAGGAI